MQRRDNNRQVFFKKIHLSKMRRRPAYLFKLQVLF